MLKWYQLPEIDKGIVLSSRIRLARNIAGYPFAYKISNADSEKMLEDVKNAVIGGRTFLASQFNYIKVSSLPSLERASLIEKHIISPQLASKETPCGVLLKDDESVSIMLGEEDHLRIQAVYAGSNIESAFDLASKIDDLIEESVEYAFDSDFGFLTSCPTNTGTGLRASYMVHIPALESSEQFKNIINAISKLGITARGIYGEGTEPLGSIYQISNQVTLGQSENEIINNLKNVITQIITQETKMREKIIDAKKVDFEDQVFRSLGILTHARRLNDKEAMVHLSNIRLGYISDKFEMPFPKCTVYEIIMGIQQGNLLKKIGNAADVEMQDKIRAEFIRNQFN